MGFSRQEYWSGLPLPSPGDLPDPGIEPRSSTLQADPLSSKPPGKPWVSMVDIYLSGQQLFLGRTFGEGYVKSSEPLFHILGWDQWLMVSGDEEVIVSGPLGMSACWEGTMELVKQWHHLEVSNWRTAPFSPMQWPMKSKVKATQSCPALCDSMDYTAHGILQARILEWVAFPFFKGSSQPRDWTLVCHIAGGLFTSWVTREAQEYWSV